MVLTMVSELRKVRFLQFSNLLSIWSALATPLKPKCSVLILPLKIAAMRSGTVKMDRVLSTPYKAHWRSQMLAQMKSLWSKLTAQVQSLITKLKSLLSKKA